MAQEQDLIEFDDNEAIAFILKNLPREHQESINEEIVQYVLDIICDYYDENHFFDEDEVSEANIAEDDMLNYIAAIIKKEKLFIISNTQLQLILDGEFAYGKSIGIYSDDE